MKRKELKEIIENCCEGIEQQKGYKSYDAVLEILQSIDKYEIKIKGDIEDKIKKYENDIELCLESIRHSSGWTPKIIRMADMIKDYEIRINELKQILNT